MTINSKRTLTRKSLITLEMRYNKSFLLKTMTFLFFTVLVEETSAKQAKSVKLFLNYTFFLYYILSEKNVTLKTNWTSNWCEMFWTYCNKNIFAHKIIFDLILYCLFLNPVMTQRMFYCHWINIRKQRNFIALPT